MQKFCLILAACLVLAGNARAETILCPKLKGNILAINWKYAKVEFAADNVVITKTGGIATIIAGDDERMECMVVADTDKLFTCVSVQDLSTNIITYYRDTKRVLYSKHNHLLETQVQYYAVCNELK